MNMKIQSPAIITSRLLPGIRIGDTEISIEIDGETGEGRTRYRYYIDAPLFKYSDTDLKSGCGGGDELEGLESLLSFLGACGESYSYTERTGRESENANLFPAKVAAWAAENSDALGIASYELHERECD